MKTGLISLHSLYLVSFSCFIATQMYSSQPWRLGRPKPRCRVMWCLSDSLSGFRAGLFLCPHLEGSGRTGRSYACFIRALIPEASLPGTIILGLIFQLCIQRSKHSVSSEPLSKVAHYFLVWFLLLLLSPTGCFLFDGYKSVIQTSTAS